MKTRFTVNVQTGSITRALGGQSIIEPMPVLTAGDLLDGEVVFVNSAGTDVTASFLGSGQSLLVGLRARSGAGAILAQSSGYSYAAGVGSFALSLNTTEARAFVAGRSAGALAWIEFETTSAGGSVRDTIAQRPVRLMPEVNMVGDVPPATAAESAEAAAAHADAAETAKNEAVAARNEAVTTVAAQWSGKTPPTGDVIGSVNPARCTQAWFIGDSITYGANASPYSAAYSQLVSSTVGWASKNTARGSANSTAFARQVLPGYVHPEAGTNDRSSPPSSIVDGQIFFLNGDYNGLRDFGNVFGYQRHMRRVLRAVVTWLVARTGEAVTGATATTSGTWSASSQYSGLGRTSSTANDTISFSANGDTVYLAMLAHSAAATPFVGGTSGRPASTGSTFTVEIDGVAQGTFENYLAYGSRKGYNGTDSFDPEALDYAPWGYRFTGLGAGRHTVVIRVASGDATRPVTFLYGVGSGDMPRSALAGPFVVVQTSLRPTVAGGVSLTTEAQIDSALTAFRGAQRRIVREFQEDGLRVLLADTEPFYDNTTTSTGGGDNVHPNGTGHAQIASALVAAVAPPVVVPLPPLSPVCIGDNQFDQPEDVELSGAGTNTSSIMLSFARDALNRRLTLGGHSMQATERTTGNAANLALQYLGGNVVCSATTQISAGAGFKGTTGSGAPAAGSIGEHLFAQTGAGSPVSLTSGTTATVASRSLEAGDWEIFGEVGFLLTGATCQSFVAGSSTTAATLDSENTFRKVPISTTTLTDSYHQGIPSRRVSLAATTTVHLVARSIFSAGTVAAFGIIRARRAS